MRGRATPFQNSDHLSFWIFFKKYIFSRDVPQSFVLFTYEVFQETSLLLGVSPTTLSIVAQHIYVQNVLLGELLA